MQDWFMSNQRRPAQREPSTPETFKEFDAVELYCNTCAQAVPVRKRLLLVLPEGDKYEYLCSFCGTSVGTKVVRGGDQLSVLV